MILFHIHDEFRRPPASRKLNARWTVLAVPLDAISDVESCTIHHCIVDVDVTSVPKALNIRALYGRMERGGTRIFACDRSAHHAITQAKALGATQIIDRPIEDRDLLRLLDKVPTHDDQPASTVVGSIALALAFRSIGEGKVLSAGHMERAVESIADDIHDIGIEDWLASIRAHHAGTYQHCLIVTGLATAFGQSLKLAASDLGKLTVAALLHDIGKAKIDLAILDKNGPLTPAEREIIQMHPVWGADHLEAHGTVAEDIRIGVRHHHELLDGSGYPDGLRGDRITDLTRLLTIVDIFGALVEHRSYKPPMSGETAYGIVRKMAEEGKVEKALVAAFRPVAMELKLPTQPLQHSA